jgi:hypothetical protein
VRIEKAVVWASFAVAVVVIGACISWALLVQVMVTPACDIMNPPANAGYLDCQPSG